MIVIRRSGLRASRSATVAPAMPQPMIRTSVWPKVFTFPELVIAAELLTNIQHSLNRMQRSAANLFVDLDLILNVNKGGECVFQRDLVHVGAANVAQTQHLLLRIGGSDVITH